MNFAGYTIHKAVVAWVLAALVLWVATWRTSGSGVSRTPIS